MCGIVGLYLKNPALESQLGKLFEPMLEAMTDRGPDSAGFAIYGDEVPEGWVKLTLQATTEGYDFKALVEAVDMLETEGLSAVFARHQRLGAACRAAVLAWGLDVQCADPAVYSPVLTGVVVPQGVLKYSAADHYNRGTALAKAGELEAALDAYDQALERQPQMPAALANKALVEQALQQRQQQKQQEQEQKQQQDNAAGSSAAPQSPQNPANQAPASKDNEANAQSAPPPGEPAQSKAQQAPSPGQTDKPATPGTPASAKPEPSDAATQASARIN